MIPNFHDGQLSGLSVSGKTASLSIMRYGGELWRIELSGVRHLKADDFREGNAISFCEVVSNTEPSHTLLETVASGPHEAAAEEHHDRYRLFINGMADDVRTGKLSLLYIEPSYGCQVIAVCERVEARQVG